jgi:uncharacterized membrane protein HdeD (DUF308 family)
MTTDTEHHHQAVAWSRIGRRWALAFGVITIVALALLGIFWIASGVMEMSLALRLRSAAQPAHGWYARPRGAT